MGTDLLDMIRTAAWVGVPVADKVESMSMLQLEADRLLPALVTISFAGGTSIMIRTDAPITVRTEKGYLSWPLPTNREGSAPDPSTSHGGGGKP